MERTTEFHSILSIFLSHEPASGGKQADSIRPPSRIAEPSNFLQSASKIAQQLHYNDDLVQNMTRISSKKEFSNDPSRNMQEITSTFQARVSWIQDQVKRLKVESERGYETSHVQQHQKLIVANLTKLLTSQVTNFKHSLKAHGKHLEERSKRVQQYGHSENSGVQSAVLSQSGKYAMFGAPSSGDGLGGFGQTPVGLHHRGGALGSQPSPASTTPAIRSYSGLNSNAASSGSANKGHHHQHHHHHQQQQQQQQVYKSNNGYRLHAAEKVESTIKQMGEMFTQMASLVAEQGETITRIEDDVEEGLMHTTEAKDHIQRVYDITKGNRSMIIKVFAILLFFILLFLVWT